MIPGFDPMNESVSTNQDATASTAKLLTPPVGGVGSTSPIGRSEKLGRVNTTKRFDDQGEIDEGDKHHVEFLEARENAPKSLQPSE